MSMTARSMVVLLILSADVAAGDTLRLGADDAAARAVAVSARTAAAAARVEAAGERVLAADAGRMPTLDAEASFSHRSSVPELAIPAAVPEIGGTVLFPDIVDTSRAAAVLSQPLLAGGAIRATRTATRHDQEAVGADATRVEAELRLEARVGYWRALAGDAAVEAARAEAARARRLLDDAASLAAAGMAVRADELAAQARLAAAEVRVVEASAGAANRLGELRSLLALSPATELELVDRGSDLPEEPPALEPLLAEALRARPELAAVAARLAALGGRIEAAGAPRRPRVALSARWDLARPNERFLPLEDTWQSSWSVGVTGAWRLFDGSRTAAEAGALRAERAALEADRAELERLVRLDVESALRDLVSARAAATAAGAAVAAAAAREADSGDRYGAGLAPVSEVLDAQAELAEAELARVRAHGAAWIADAALRRAVAR